MTDQRQPMAYHAAPNTVVRGRDHLSLALPAGGFCVCGFFAPWILEHDSPAGSAAVIGVYGASLLWAAAWAALAPGRWILRFLLMIAISTLVATTTVAGASTLPRAPEVRIAVQCASVIPTVLLAAQVPFLGMRWLRGWRIVFGERAGLSDSAGRGRFDISDLLGVTAGIAVALGSWRFAWGDAESNASVALTSVFWSVPLVVMSCLSLPLLSFALGNSSIERGLVRTVAAVGGVSFVVYGALAAFLRVPDLQASWVTLVWFAMTAFVFHGSFLVARDVGYRLVRVSRHAMQSATSGLPETVPAASDRARG